MFIGSASLRLRQIEFLVDLAWLVFAGGYCMVAASYPPEGRLVPLTVGLAAVAVGLLHILGNFIGVVRPFTHGAAASAAVGKVERSQLKAIVWAVALLLGVFLIGALAAIFLFFLVYFGVRGKRWLLGLISAVLMTILSWGLFGQLISLQLPQGLLTEYFLRWF
jgi:Tripartite tricarboxylate transporter TctB family